VKDSAKHGDKRIGSLATGSVEERGIEREKERN